jgi:hypothetical protein
MCSIDLYDRHSDLSVVDEALHLELLKEFAAADNDALGHIQELMKVLITIDNWCVYYQEGKHGSAPCLIAPEESEVGPDCIDRCHGRDDHLDVRRVES